MIEKLMLKMYGPDWKTSLSGDLSVVVTVATILSGYLVVTPSSPKWLSAVSAGCAVLAAFGKSQVGRKMVDAGSVLAKVPGVADPQVVPSHEVPDDKTIKEIVK
jgi:hypothetical protein